MPKRMLIDATHPEETRVVVINGTRLEEFDFESSTKRQVKGNIYLAKITRVEPSLQAAFVDYGGNRHGFLAFSEVHPDYYRIPVSDRPQGTTEPLDGNGDRARDNNAANGEDTGVPLASALPEPVPVPLTDDADDLLGDEADGEPSDAQAPTVEIFSWEDADRQSPPWEHRPRGDSQMQMTGEDGGEGEAGGTNIGEASLPEAAAFARDSSLVENSTPTEPEGVPHAGSAVVSAPQPGQTEPQETTDEPVAAGRERDEALEADRESTTIALRAAEESVVALAIPRSDGAETAGESGQQQYDEPSDRFGAAAGDGDSAEFDNGDDESDGADSEGVSGSVETLGGDEVEEVEEADAAERRRRHPMRHYKIQEVIKRRQIMLVQVAKEERGNKGAALTTYLSLAGRYCVLMPNTNRGGGVSRKITSIADRRRLKDILEELDIPEGMGVIVRTAGAERSKAEIKRDYEYLLRLWNEIRDLTLRSTAPALIYEEGNLIKRSIRDLYTRDMDEVLVEGEEGYRTAKAFMRTLMPSHAKRVQPYRDPQIGLFHRFQVESQIDAIHSPVAQLRSGGYLVINQTEALVAIDVNSGRSTRERNIEETALRTNLEAAEEIARQLRLRDLAGLIVIDFIDMEEHRNQIAVERRLKEALKSDRARIQVGRISPFGLLEMSRQRLRPSLTEASTQPCPHCGGTGFIRSVESTALHVLRSIEEEGIRRRSAETCVYVPTTVALYILNQKRDSLNQIESRYALRVMVARDDSLIPPSFRLERLRPYGVGEALPVRPIQAPTLPEYEDEDEDENEDAETELEASTDAAVRGVAGTAGEGGEPEQDNQADDERGRRRRRRRRRRDEPREARHGASTAGTDDEPVGAEADGAGREQAEALRDGESEAERRRRRRGRRGGRLRPRRDEQRDERREDISASDGAAEAEPAAAETIEIVPAEASPLAAASETISLDPWSADPWSARYGLETASLAPFAGEPLDGEPPAGEPFAAGMGQPALAAETEHETPADAFREPATVPIAEAEEGVPFASDSEREFEATEAGAHANRRWGEPARIDAGMAPEHAAEPGSSASDSGGVAEPQLPAEPKRAESPPGAPVFANLGNGELAAVGSAPEPHLAEPANAVPAPFEATQVEPALAELEPAPAEPGQSESSPTPVSRPAEDVLVVTEKPANPRRGWWRRVTHL